MNSALGFTLDWLIRWIKCE